jgi:Tfp pilus assembly protein PilN
MLELNLISGRLGMMQAKRKLLRSLRIFNIICFFISVFSVAIAFSIFSQTVKIHASTATYKTEIQKNKTRYNVDTMEKQWIEYLDDLTVADMALNHPYWAVRFQELSRVVPIGICIEKIAIIPGDGTPFLSLDVVAMSGEKKAFERIDTLIGALEKSPLFGAGVKLESHEQRATGDKAMESFKIKIPVKPL